MNIPQNKSAASAVLVTGGTGFAGAYIIRDLIHAGFRVKAIRRKSGIPFFAGSDVVNAVEWIEGDILDPVFLEEAMDDAHAVVHAAATVSFYEKDREAIFNTNIEGTINVVNAAIEKNITRFVHV